MSYAVFEGISLVMLRLALLLLLTMGVLPVLADEPVRLVLHDHTFSPTRLDVPAGVKFRLTVKNDSDKTIEWESEELDREEVIKPGEEGTIFLGPLDPGTYPYFDDRHQDSKGVLVAK
jgi:hypothetical protein